MCSLDFELLFDRVGSAAPLATRRVTAVWGGGDEDTGRLALVSGDGVEAVYTAAGRGGAASAPDPTGFRPVSFGTSPRISGGAAWPVLVTCSGCGEELRLDAVGYRQAVRRLAARGWRYVARPHERAWCPECRTRQGEHRSRKGAARRAPASPAAARRGDPFELDDAGIVASGREAEG
jgi:hypothetical protein